MYRRKTVERIQREHARELDRRDQRIADLLDRLMYVLDKPWGVAPVQASKPEPEPKPDDRPVFDDVDELPDS